MQEQSNEKKQPRRVKIDGHRGLYRRPSDGKIEFCYSDANGKTRWKTAAENTIRAAEAERGETIAKSRRGELAVPSKRTFGEVAEAWILSLEKRRPALQPETLALYRGQLDRHILPVLGTRPIHKITPTDMLDFLEAFAMKKKPTDGNKAWTGAVTQTQCLSRCNQVFKYALRRRWVFENPVAALETHERPKHTKRKKRILTEEELGWLFEASADHWRPFFQLLAYTGLRVSEGLGLQWGDIDFGRGYVSVREQLARYGKDRRKQTKTPAAVRDVVLAPALARILKAHKLAAANCGPADFVFEPWEKNGGVLPTQVGRSATNTCRIFARTVVRAGIDTRSKRAPTPHDLRHTFAALLIKACQGKDITFIARQLGHEKPSMTLDEYADVFEEVTSEQDVRAALTAAAGKVLERNVSA